MPRKIKDESGPYDAFDFTPPEGLKDEAIIEIATEFDIPNAAAFLESFKSWATHYWNNQRGFRNVATATQRRESAKRIHDACERLVELIEGTGVDTIHSLRTLASEDVRSVFSDEDILRLMQSGAVSRPDEIGRLSYDIEGTLLKLRLLEFASGSLASRMECVQQEIGNKSPISDMDRRVLMTQLREWWESSLGRKYSRRFEPESDENSSRPQQPLLPQNSCSAFVLRCSQLINRRLTVDMIDAAMKDNIAHANRTPD